MNERPILFSGAMVRAILDGYKTQTRRVVKFGGKGYGLPGLSGQVQEHREMKAVYALPMGGFVFWTGEVGKEFSDRVYANAQDGIRCPYGEPGDRLWVRETWRAEELPIYGEDGIRYRADEHFRMIENTREASDLWGEAYRPDYPWRPSIFMPRWASRITLEIVNVRVERVQAISEADALAEGMVDEGLPFYSPQVAYQDLWDKINQKRGFGWDVNPWVWVVEFVKL